MKITVDIPEDIAEYGSHLENLLRLCVTKLFVNAHKSTPDMNEAEEMIDRLREELKELEDQLVENRLKGNSLLEIADVVNFALLTYIAIRNEQMKYKGQVDEQSRLKSNATAQIHKLPSGEGVVGRSALDHDSDHPKTKYNGA